MMKTLLMLSVMIWVEVATTCTQVTEKLGHNATLQCCFDPSLNLSTLTFDFTRGDNKVVYVYRNGKDHPDAQDPQFRGRTALIHEDLIRGVITLQIFSVQLSDSGIYSCNVLKVGDSVLLQHVMLNVTNTTEVCPNTTRSPEEGERTKPEVENTDDSAIVWVYGLLGAGLVGAGLLFLVKRRRIQRCWRKLTETPTVEDANSCQMQTLTSSAAGDQNQNIRNDPGHIEQQGN